MPSRLGLNRRTIGALIVVAAFGAAAFAAWHAKHHAPAESIQSVLVREHGGFRYEYHVPTGRESLYDAARDPKGLTNLIEDHRDVAAICRRALEREKQVGTLDELRARYDAEIRRLRALGYL